MNTFPKFTSSDSELDRTYQYRCELYQKHIKETPAGYVITEFLPDVPWAGIYNTINCAASHHFREGRWLQDTKVLEEYANFWCTTGNPRLYSFPIADSFLALEKVTGDPKVADQHYERLKAIFKEWDDHRAADGMYRQTCNYDGMEYSISGDGIRPTINSYMAADAEALSIIGTRKGDSHQYHEIGRWMKQQINEKLWNEEIGMFGVISDEGEVQNVREQIGYIPWIYGIPDAGKDTAFRYLLDENCFLAPYGLRTADVTHPRYRGEYDHECLWNGPVWPFATAQTLTAVIQYLHAEEQPKISKEEFMQLLLTYAYSQRDADGTPYLDENMDPDTGVWLAREIMRNWNRPGKDATRGRDYNHSSFIDLVMTGVVGIQPALDSTLRIHPLGTSLEYFDVKNVRYHGHVLDISWNQTTGLYVKVDEVKEYRAGDQIEIQL